MAFLNWNNQYSVKVEELDDQHRELFRLINGYMESIRNDTVKDGISKAIAGLVSYTQTHFKTEEEYMQKFGFQGYGEHKAAHDDLTSHVLQYRSRISDGSVQPEELSRFLMDWLVKHIMAVDRKYSEFFNLKGLK